MSDDSAVDHQPVFTLHLSQRAAVPLAGAAVAEAAELLGLRSSERAQLRSLTQEVVAAIVADAFDGAENIDLDVSVEQRPGTMAVVLRDRGAPSQFTYGSLPPRAAALIRLGFADGLEFHSEGRRGNRTEFLRNLHYASVTDSAEFVAQAEADAPEELAIDATGQAVLEVRAMTPDDVVGVARLFYRTYGYSAAAASVVFEPERFAELVAAGVHRATVALTPGGRIIGHLATTVDKPTALTGRIGLLAVEPDYRRHKVAVRLGFVHVTRLLEEGMIGQFSEAVTVHTGSQKIALRSGAHEVGMVLAAQSAELRFRGIASAEGTRKAVLLLYGQIGQGPERTVHVPPGYRDVAQRIYDESGLRRTVISEYERVPDGLPEQSRFRVQLNHESGVVRIFVQEYGVDFVAALQRQLQQVRFDRFDAVLLYLPLSAPLTGYFGSGLQALGLSFSGIYPEYDEGDVLVLQSLALPPDLASIEIESEFGGWIRDFVVGDYQAAHETSEQRERSRTHMSRIYEAL